MKGILAFVNSANIDEPDLVIAKFVFEKNSVKLLLKLKMKLSSSILAQKLKVEFQNENLHSEKIKKNSKLAMRLMFI